MNCLVCKESFGIRLVDIGCPFGGTGGTIKEDIIEILGDEIRLYLEPCSAVCTDCMTKLEKTVRLIRNLRETIKRSHSSTSADFKPDRLTIWENLPYGTEGTHDRNSVGSPECLLVKINETEYDSYREALLNEEIKDTKVNSSLLSRQRRAGTPFVDAEVSQLMQKKRRGRKPKRKNHKNQSRCSSAATFVSFESTSRPNSVCSSTLSRASSNRSRRSRKSNLAPSRCSARLRGTPFKESFYCDINPCDQSESFDTLDALTAHKVSCHRKGMYYKCEECPAQYVTENDLALHRQKHVGLTLCAFCDMETNSLQEYQDHISKHLEYSVNCIYCDKSYLTGSEMEQHIRRIHPKEKKRVRSRYSEYFILETT